MCCVKGATFSNIAEVVVAKSVVWGLPLMGSRTLSVRALSVESAEEGASLLKKAQSGE